ncbi:pseudouridine synthase [Gongronella butleri]|nr:pseudouridine synthase [Gongronella butleri]
MRRGYDAKRLEQHTLEIVYQDADYLVVNKPYDCGIQDEPAFDEPSVDSMIKSQFPDLPPMKNLHQLDYATSGIYMLAANRRAAGAVQRLFEQRLIEKTYLAIVQGHVARDASTANTEEDEHDGSEDGATNCNANNQKCAQNQNCQRFTRIIDQPIAEDPAHRFRMLIDPAGRPAFTTVQVMQHGFYYDPDQNGAKMPVSKVLLFPKSGRRHQLRVHLKSIGHPIIGDYNYEEPFTKSSTRMMLHAYKIDVPLRSGLWHMETRDPFRDLEHFSWV